MSLDGIELLYEEGPCLAIAKPGGLLTQAPPGIDSVEARLKQFLKQRDAKPGKVYLGVPHRLDRPASGAMVFAKHVRAARRLSEQFEDRLVGKTYWAVVEGDVSPEAGQLRDYVRKVPGEPRSEIVPREHPEGRIALLRYRVLEQNVGLSWLEIELETGRTHQIRVQFASRGFPLQGDAQYGARQAFGPTTDDRRARWIALHARRLSFRHPMKGDAVEIVAPLPVWWRKLPLHGLSEEQLAR